MASISGLSSSTSSSLSSASSIRGYGGLASGLDRDSLIESMTYATTAKIQAQKQQQQKLQWTQTAIQSISTKLIDFSRKYTLYSSSTNLLSKSFFGSSNITANGANASKVTVTGSGSAAKGVTITGVKQMATNASLSTKEAASQGQLVTGELSENLDVETKSSNLEGQTLRLEVGNSTYSVKLTSGTNDDGYTYKYDTPEAAAESLNKLFAETTTGTDSTGSSKHLSDSLEAYVENGTVQFRSTDTAGNSVIIKGGTTQALNALGITKDALGDKGLTLESTGTSLTNSVDTLVKTETELSRLAGKKLNFSYNDSSSAITLMSEDEINEAVKASQEKGENKTALEILQDDMQTKLDKAFGEGRVTVSLTGQAGDSSRALKFETTIPKTGGTLDNSSVLSITGGDVGMLGSNGVLGVSAGTSNRLNLSASLEKSSLSALKDATGNPVSMGAYLKNALTAGTATVEEKENFGNSYVESLSDEEKAALGDSGVAALKSGDLSGVDWDNLDLANVSMDLEVNGTKIEGLTYASSVNDIMSAINKSEAGVSVSYQSSADKLIMEATSAGTSGNVKLSGIAAGLLFGDSSNHNVTDGQDAIVSVKYAGSNEEKELVRGSNTFSMDGMNITVNGTFGYKNVLDESGKITDVVRDETSEDISFTAKVDADKIVTTVSDMIKDYNEILELVNSEVSTKPNRSYAPLTDQQREEMSESQIEKWEAEAKKGSLFNDSDLRTLADKMRFILSSSYEDKVALEDMGISVSTSYSDNGKLVFDETKFRAALESDPEAVQSAFARSAGTNGEDDKGGFMVNMSSLFKIYATDTGSNKGILVDRAGSSYAPTSVLNNNIQKQLDSIEDYIDRLNDKLKTETDRYITKFTQLETLISQMNSQSGYLSSLTG